MISKKKAIGYFIALLLVAGGTYQSLMIRHDGKSLSVTPTQAWGMRRNSPIHISETDLDNIKIEQYRSGNRGTLTKYKITLHTVDGNSLTLYKSGKKEKCRKRINLIHKAFTTKEALSWRTFPLIPISYLGAFVFICVLGNAHIMTEKEKRQWMPNQ